MKKKFAPTPFLQKAKTAMLWQKRRIKPLSALLVIFHCLLFSGVAAQPPVITSFTPASGPIGTSVTISGSGFSSTAANNIVYFGAVKAVVSTASASSVTAIVPVGATYQPLSVTTGNLTAYSNTAFVVTFPANSAGITPNSFTAKTDFITSNDPESIAIGDLDGDGKPDMVSANRNSNNISVFKNNSSSGAISFAAKADYATGVYPVNVIISDLDGDGKPDLAVANNASNSISIFKNTSTTGIISFASRVDYASRNNPNNIAIGDLDGDGKPDLAVANNTFPDVLIFKNTSTGGAISFNAGLSGFSGSYTSIAITDVDGDGKPDLIGTNSGNFLSVNRNTSTSGTFSFAPVIEFITANSNRTLSIGDLDGDGRPDAAVAAGGSTSVLRNTSSSGTVSFATKTDVAVGDNPRGIAISDVDGDGKPDLAVTNSGGADLSVIKNISSNGSISFAAKVDFETGQYPYSVAIGDLDGDGKPDLSVANHNYTSSTISIIKNQTDGPNISSFTPANGTPGTSITITGSSFTGATSVTIGGIAATSFTVNSDTEISAVVPAVTGGSVAVTTPNGSGSLSGFYNGPTISSFSPVSGPVGTTVTIAGANFNPVAANNIVYVGAVKATVSAATSGSITITIPAGTTYQPITVTTGNRTACSIQSFATTFPANAAGITPNSFAAKVDLSLVNGSNGVSIGDLDGDGKADMVSFTPSSNAFFIFRNISTTGVISFGTAVQLPGGTNVNGLAFGDLDGDGRIDIVITNYSAGTVSVFRNISTTGSISFAAKMDVATNFNPASVAIADVDGDGKPELAIVRSGSSVVSLLRNTSSGASISFAAKTDISINGVSTIVFGDLDGDGKPELVVPDYYAGTVSVLKNTSLAGTLSFGTQINYATGTNSINVIISDLTGDGKPDLAVANQGSATVSVLKNESSGTTPFFASAINYTTGAGPASVSVADVDGDGRPDLAVANNNSFSVSVLKNTGTTGSIAFAAKVDFTTGANVGYVTTGDMDGDGKPDLVVTNTSPSSVSILRNQVAGTDIFSFTPANAGVGANVTINGINLTGATAVSFGGVAATGFTVNSDAQITAVVAGTAGGKVSVTTPKGIAILNGFYNGPVINSFSPASGPIGTAVTISGTNFSATPANNTVFFGAVKALVSAASSTSLTVTVPVGATYQPFTVTTGNHTAYSGKPFAVTFPSIATGFTPNTLAAKLDIASGTNPANVAAGDFDGDGKADMVVSNYGSNIISIYKNNGTPGNISFSTKLDVGNGYYPSKIVISDINGDGKQDLAVIIYNSNTVDVYRNTSTGGTISFASEISIYTGIGNQPRGLVIGDLDGDGKPDMAVTGASPNPLGIFKNISTAGNISFAPKQEVSPGSSSPYGIAIADFDSDGKPDLAVTNYVFGNFVLLVSVFKNISVPGIISFGDRKEFAIGNGLWSITTGDVDGDGKPDMVVTNSGSNNVSVLRNTTATGGVISFAPKIDYPTGTGPYSVSLGDFDGDEKPDMAVTNASSSTLSLFKNGSTAGTISFAPKVDYVTGSTPNGIAIADWDCDGQPDLAVANYGANTVSLLRNQVGAPSISSFTPANAGVGTTVTVNGSSFTGATAVSFGGIAATSFTVVSDAVITAVVAAVAGGNAAVTTPKGTAFLSGFYNGPVISSFTPVSGPIGTSVTISGTNFSATAADNIVYFGAVKAVVSAASATSLTVIVPVGTTFQPLTVTNSYLTAYAAKPFIVTFPTNTSGFTAGSFAAKADFGTATNPYATSANDFDGDGKADIAVANSGSNSFSVLRNTGTSGTVSFANKVDFVTGTAPVSIFAGDMDGDGKPDVAITNFNSGTVSVFKNLSTVGSISFTAKVDYVTSTNPSKVKIADINADGKPDLVVVNSANSGSVVSVYKNTSVGGIISFAGKVDFLNERYVQSVAIGDLDSDGKPDLVIAYSSDYKFSVLRNTTANGVISFAAKTDFTTTGTSYSLDVADLDSDGKDDLAISNYTTNVISFFRNTTTGSTVSFAPKVDAATGIYPQGIAINDMDGDNKPDVAVANYSFGVNTLSLLKNTSTGGVISFAAKTDYATGASPVSLSIADADGDGKPDLFAANYSSNTVSVLRNQLAAPALCAGGNTSYTSNITGASYQWQVNTGSGFINITDNGNYTGTNTVTLQLSNLPSAWYGYLYRCVVDGANSNMYSLQFANTWVGSVNTAWENAANWSCGVVPDGNTDVLVNAGTVTINSAATCRSIKVNPGVSFTVNTGYNLMITH